MFEQHAQGSVRLFFFFSLHVEYCETIQFPSRESFEKLTFTEQWKSQELKSSFPPGFLVGCLLVSTASLCFFLSCSVP